MTTTFRATIFLLQGLEISIHIYLQAQYKMARRSLIR